MDAKSIIQDHFSLQGKKSADDRSSESKSLLATPTPSRVPGLSQDELKLLYESLGSRGSLRGYPSKHKHYQNFTAAAPIQSLAATTANLLTAIPLDTTLPNNARQGMQIRVKHLTMRGQIFWLNAGAVANSVGTLEANPVRIVVYVDKQPQLGGSIWAENLVVPLTFNSLTVQLTGGDAVNTIAPYSTITHGTRYEMLLDKQIQPNHWAGVTTGAAGTTYAAGRQHFEFSIPMDMTITYYANGALAVLENSLEYHIITDTLQAGQVAPNWMMAYDVTFEDLGDGRVA